MDLTVILKRHSNKKIVDRLIDLYPDQKKSASGYRKVLKKIRSLQPVHKGNMKIDVSHIVDDTDPEGTYEYDHVSGIVDGEKMTYAIEFTPWNEWLGMHFTVASLKYPEVDLIAHCIWEMTWSGFDEEEIQGRFSGLMETVKEIVEEHKEKDPE